MAVSRGVRRRENTYLAASLQPGHRRSFVELARALRLAEIAQLNVLILPHFIDGQTVLPLP